MGSAAETGVGCMSWNSRSSEKAAESSDCSSAACHGQLPGLASLVPPPLCSPCPWQPSPVRGVAQEQVAGGEAQDEEDLLQDHLPAQVTHQIPLGM